MLKFPAVSCSTALDCSSSHIGMVRPRNCVDGSARKQARVKEDEGVLANVGKAEVRAEFSEFRKSVPEAVGGVGRSGLERGQRDNTVRIGRGLVEMWRRLRVAGQNELAAAGGGIGTEASERKLVEEIEQQVGGGAIENAEVDAEIIAGVLGPKDDFGALEYSAALLGGEGRIGDAAEGVVLPGLIAEDVGVRQQRGGRRTMTRTRRLKGVRRGAIGHVWPP